MTGLAAQAALLLWPWLAGAFGLGLLVGVATCSTERAGGFGRTAVLLVGGAVLALAAVALLGLVPGRAGLFVELGLAFLVSYGLGSGIGCLGRRLARP